MTYLLRGAARPLYTRKCARQRDHPSPTPGAARTRTRAGDRNGIPPHRRCTRNGNPTTIVQTPCQRSQPSHTNESARAPESSRLIVHDTWTRGQIAKCIVQFVLQPTPGPPPPPLLPPAPQWPRLSPKRIPFLAQCQLKKILNYKSRHERRCCPRENQRVW